MIYIHTNAGTGFRWYDLVYKFRLLGYSVDYMVDFSVTTDLRNSSWRVLDLDQPGMGMSREYLMKGEQDPDVQVLSPVIASQLMEAWSDGRKLFKAKLLKRNFPILVLDSLLS